MLPSEDRLVRKPLPLVRAIAHKIGRCLPPNVLASDLVAAGSIGLLLALRTNGGDGGPTWKQYACLRIRGAIIDELRREDPVPKTERRRSAPFMVEVSDHLADSTDTFSKVADAEERGRLAHLVSKLPARDAFVVRAKVDEEMKGFEIASSLGISETRVYQIYKRAVERLREMAGEDAL